MVSELYSDRQNLEKSIAGLRGVEQDVRFRLRTMLETFLKQLEEAPLVAAEAPKSDDFADRAQAIKEAIAREETVVSSPPPKWMTPVPEPAAPETSVAEAPPVPPRQEAPAPRVEVPAAEADDSSAQEADDSPAQEAVRRSRHSRRKRPTWTPALPDAWWSARTICWPTSTPG